MTAQAAFDEGDTHVAPGDSAMLNLSVVNLGNAAETFTLVPVGLAAGWTVVHPANLTLFGGFAETVTVEVRPPLLSSTSAGRTSLGVRIVPMQTPDDVTIAETVLVVEAVDDRRLIALQPAQRARRRATYDLMLENRGNSPATCRLRLVDSTSRVSADFNPPSVSVEPGASTSIRARVRGRGLRWGRTSSTIAFQVDAEQQGVRPASTTATLVQAPVIPERLGTRLLGLVLLAALLTAGWFTLLRPAVRRAADAAARRSGVAPVVTTAPPTTFGVPTTVPGDTPVVTTTTVVAAPTTAPAPPSATGSPFAVRLSTSPTAGSGQTVPYAAPAGTVVQITDLNLQNPNFDRGVATLSKGDAVLYQWRLDTIQSRSEPLVSPIVLQPGEQFNFQVTCDAVGQNTAATCVPGLLLVGTQRPAG